MFAIYTFLCSCLSPPPKNSETLVFPHLSSEMQSPLTSQAHVDVDSCPPQQHPPPLPANISAEGSELTYIWNTLILVAIERCIPYVDSCSENSLSICFHSRTVNLLLTAGSKVVKAVSTLTDIVVVTYTSDILTSLYSVMCLFVVFH